MPDDITLASDLEPGRYICLKTPGWMAWLIRASTRSQFNHVVIAGPDGQIAEATLRGVHLGQLSQYAGYTACANVNEPMTAEQGMEVWAAAEAMVGEPYAYPELLAIGLADLGWHWNLLFQVLGKPPWRICSQLVALAGKAATPPLQWDCNDRYSDQVTPAALARRPGVVPVIIG